MYFDLLPGSQSWKPFTNKTNKRGPVLMGKMHFCINFFLKSAPECPARPINFLHYLQSKSLFEPHNSGEPYLLLLGYPSQRLLHVPELKYDFPVLHQVVIPSHSGSSCSFHNYFRYIDFSFLKVLMLVPVRL